MPWEHVQLLIPKLVRNAIGPDFTSLLDVGGGGGLVGKGYWSSALKITTLDIFPASKASTENFVCGNALNAVEIFGAKSFDVVMCCEMIEHLPKEDGPALLDALESVARKLVIITTPHGFLKQDREEYPDEPWANNPHQKHLCGYEPEEFTSRGYQFLANGQDDGGAGYQIIVWKVM